MAIKSRGGIEASGKFWNSSMVTHSNVSKVHTLYCTICTKSSVINHSFKASVQRWLWAMWKTNDYPRKSSPSSACSKSKLAPFFMFALFRELNWLLINSSLWYNLIFENSIRNIHMHRSTIVWILSGSYCNRPVDISRHYILSFFHLSKKNSLTSSMMQKKTSEHAS